MGEGLARYYPEVDGQRQALPWQQKFHAGITPSGKKADHILLSGGVGSGMTTAICADIAYQLEAFPGIKITVVANFEYVLEKFFESQFRRLPLGVFANVSRIDAKTHSVTFVNGSTLSSRPCTDPDTLRGFQCHKAYMIEASDWTKTETYQVEEDDIEGYEPPDEDGFEAPIYTGNKITVTRTRDIDIGHEVFTALALRCSAPGDFPRGVVVQQNPRGHNWAYNVFVKPVNCFTENEDNTVEYEHTSRACIMYGQPYPESTFYTIQIPSAANTFLKPGYVQAMLQHMKEAPAMKQRMIDAAFYVITPEAIEQAKREVN